MSARGDRVLAIALTAAAVLVAAAAVRREFFPARAGAVDVRTPAPPYFDSTGRSSGTGAIVVGNPNAPLQIVEFVDFECPVCAGIHRTTLRNLKARFGDSLAIRYVHFPLPQHRFARIAAQAVECADKTGRAGPLIDILFERQDSLGLKPWGSFAHDVGVKDTLAFARCVWEHPQASRIDSGHALALRRRVTGTPSFIVNGWVLPTVPSAEEFERIVNAILAGRDPSR
jgi:protein-disulfide isomerase